MKFNSLLFSVIFVASTFTACSSTSESLDSGSSSGSSLYPAWYNSAGFEQDSSFYYGFATAIASDSTVALERAEQQARTNLGIQIGEMSESIRTDLVEGGSSAAGNTDFIIILRTAHTNVETDATLTNSSSSNSESHFRAFSSVKISKQELVKALENGFNGHPRYWAEFSGSQTFSAFFK